ncbi:type II toxin-antitoxin system HicB family antitoxin [Fischerella thermalis]|uniref:type II toxin-antitoxin system HicB family antitoxin n=1 Tax=Fischerella thermalis TaxID=372787 RepID=UPI002155366D|nr:type II toxin-antitoxin system HicB family antitoxin [Fischerella thermalis]
MVNSLAFGNLQGDDGELLLRMQKSLHRRLIEKAEVEGVSLNQYIVYLLGKSA